MKRNDCSLTFTLFLQLSDTPKGERSSQLLSALNSHKDR